MVFLLSLLLYKFHIIQFQKLQSQTIRVTGSANQTVTSDKASWTITIRTVRPTLKEAVPGDLALALPYKTMRSIIKMIEVLDKITPGIATEHTLLYGVEAKYYSAHPKMDNKLEVTGISHLYVAGDGAGLTRGLAQASACGVYIARNILERK